MSIDRAYYSSNVSSFLRTSPDSVLGEVARNSGFAIELGQRDAWVKQIKVLREQLMPWDSQGHLFFEFVVPRMGRRIDVLAIIKRSHQPSQRWSVASHTSITVFIERLHRKSAADE